MTTIDAETATILRYALPQMEAEREALTRSIARVRIQLGMDGKPAEGGLPAVANGLSHQAAPSEEHHQVAAPPARKAAPFSAAAKKRMAAAQRLRWENYHKQKRAAM